MYTERDEVYVYNRRIGIIDKVIYVGETDEVYAYEMTIDGVAGYIVYPDDIEE